MLSRSVPWRRRWLESDMRARGPDVAIVCGYVASYIALDWISSVQTLPGVGFTLWDPTPAASLALLIVKGLRFAPALFLAGVISDGVVGGFPLGTHATLTSEAIVATGYTSVAALLRGAAHAGQGFPRVADIVWLLVVSAAAPLVIAWLVVAALTNIHSFPPYLVSLSIRHFFIGSLTGILGLLPVLLTIQQARDRWKEVSPTARMCDIGIFWAGAGLRAFSGVPSCPPLRNLSSSTSCFPRSSGSAFATACPGAQSRF